jgi:hypothetical protein
MSVRYKMDNQAPPPGATAEQANRIGGWISTYTGRPFWPCDPRIEDVDTDDIAHALSLQCRFAGHVDRFYSVAEHCFRASMIVPYEDALWALLHDAPEAYLIDLPRPLKYTPGLAEMYQECEAALMRVICRKYGLPFGEPDTVKRADVILLATEQRDLLPRAQWSMDVTPLSETITPMEPAAAEWCFKSRLAWLTAEYGLVSGA